MEEVGGIIHFDKNEQHISHLPPSIKVGEAYEAFEIVDQRKTDCGAQIKELLSTDVYEAVALHQANGVSRLAQKFAHLEAMAKELGALSAATISDELAANIVERSLADMRGLALNRLHEK